MNKQIQTSEMRSEKKPQPKVEPPVTPAPESAAPQVEQNLQAFNGGAVESQVETLQRLPTSGRQDIMRQIGQLQGNRHAQRLAATMSRAQLQRQPEDSAGAESIQRSPAAGQRIGSAKVTADALNVRSGPSASAGRLGQLKAGDSVDVYGRSGEWLAITFNGKTAYIHGGYTTFTPADAQDKEEKKPDGQQEASQPSGNTPGGSVSYSTHSTQYFSVANQITSVMEGGSTKGQYDALTTVADGGIISYGKHQCTLASGSLEAVLNAYLATAKGTHADTIKKSMAKVRNKDASLKNDQEFLKALRAAANEKEMQVAQDMVFSQRYWNPAVNAAQNHGVQSPLGYAILYDTQIQGGLSDCLEAARSACGGEIGQKKGGKEISELQFLKAFNDAREARLERLAQSAEAKGEKVRANALRGSKYRCRSFRQLLDAGNLNVSGPGGRVQISGPGSGKYTIEGFDSTQVDGQGGAKPDEKQPAPNPEAVLGNAEVTADVLNVRLGPGTDQEKLGQLSKGAQVPVVGRQGEWLRILYQGQPAYIHASYATFPVTQKKEEEKKPAEKQEPTPETPPQPDAGGLDTAVESRIKAFMQSFFIQIKVGERDGRPVTVSVRTPYHMNAGKRKTNAETNRGNSPKDAGVISANGDWLDSHGKADPASLRQIVQAAVDGGRIKPAKAGALLTAEEIRAWMVRYGVGVDCSGFVSQALNDVTGQIAQQTGSPMPKKFDVGNTGADSLNWKGNPQNFSKVEHPRDLRPGDTMWMPGSVSHIIIITNVQKTAQGVIFTTAESSAGNDIGVHDDTYRCPKSDGDFSDLQKRRTDGTWEARNSGGTFRFSRYKALAGFKDKTDGKTDPKSDAKNPQPQPDPKNPAPQPEKPIGTGTVTATQLNVRDKPAMDGQKLGELSRGTKITLLARSGEWLKISYNGKIAYVHGAYVSLEGDKKDEKPASGGDLVKKIQAVGKSLGLTVKDSNISLILSAASEFSVTDKAQLAYVFATIHHESHWGDWMTEFASGDAYEGRKDLGNTEKGDGRRYKGRGFVQLTGRINYTQYGKLFKVDLVNKPELATDPALSAKITVHGMVNGKFTGKKLSDYGSGDAYNFVNARAIINGKDRAEDIAKIARAYYQTLH